jgi:hypothetical protein
MKINKTVSKKLKMIKTFHIQSNDIPNFYLID